MKPATGPRRGHDGPASGRGWKPASAVVAALASAAVLATGAGAGASAEPQTAQARTASVSQGVANVPLPPDLAVRRPTELSLVERKQVRKLRFTSSMGNLGPGPLEVRPADADPGDCVSSGGRSALQAVFRDADGNGVFRRTLDRHARLRSVGCIRHHPTHEHWHLDDFARYTLRRESTGVTVARAHKVSFCLLDSVRWLSSRPGSPRGPHYYGCSSTSPQGISVGWADVYPSGLPGQSLDVTGVPAAMYCLEVTADPRDRLNEASELNNVRGLRVRVLPDAVQPTSEPCRSA